SPWLKPGEYQIRAADGQTVVDLVVQVGLQGGDPDVRGGRPQPRLTEQRLHLICRQTAIPRELHSSVPNLGDPPQRAREIARALIAHCVQLQGHRNRRHSSSSSPMFCIYRVLMVSRRRRKEPSSDEETWLEGLATYE